LFVHMW